MPKVEDSKIGAVVGWSFLLGLFALCWYWGFQIGESALTDPDTCWLLAVGKWISAHASLPQTDPFSWTARTFGGAYVPYQWLASLIFYDLYSRLGIKSLLFFVSIIVLVSFLLLPLCLARKLGVSLWVLGMLSALAVSAGSFHFPLRPELFSYLFISVMLYFLIQTIFVSQAAILPPKAELASWLIAVALPASLRGLILFTLWANLHSGFALGLAIVVVVILACVASAIFASDLPNGYDDRLGRLAAFFAGALMGSLITPFRFRLYAYLPELFFSPINRFNQELLPLQLHELLSCDYLPFLILQIMFFASVVPLFSSIFHPKSTLIQPDGISTPPIWSPLVYAAVLGFAMVAFVMFVAGDLCRRMIPFAVLISLAYFLAISKSGALERIFLPFKVISSFTRFSSKLGQFDNGFNRSFVSRCRFTLILIAALVCTLLGADAGASAFPLTIPQFTFGFEAPWQAVEFLRSSRPKGKLFNDPQFGDVLILSMDDKARVFIDTRFDLYGPKFCRDYFIMANGLSGYGELLESYKIDWIFFPHRAPIISKLRQNEKWRTVYQDNAAVIMVKQGLGAQ